METDREWVRLAPLEERRDFTLEIPVPDQLTHPSHEKLAAYGLGQLPPDQAALIEQHITECEPCCETIFDLSSGDTFVDLLCKAKQAFKERTVREAGQETSPTSLDVPPQLAEHPRYELVAFIGKGGMGDVYKARHRKMDRAVALKVIKREFVRKTEAVDRFHREVKTAARLSHPNIVTAYDADNAGDFHFMVMEHVDGVDFSQIIKDHGALPVTEACEYIHQAAVGLQHAHERGMVHRDIKPHNLMLTAEGTVKILDFGLASLAPEVGSADEAREVRSQLTTAGAIMGTPDFISPEQAEDARQADIRSDIYSLGATLYHLLAGRPPFADGSVMLKLKRHAQVDPERLESLRDDIPAELSAIVNRMMAKDPNERFQTPAEVAPALKSVLQTMEPVQASPLIPVQPARKRHRFLPLTAVATLFLVALAAPVVFYLQTGNGVIRVRLMDESLQATIQGEKIEVEDGDKRFEVSAGRQHLVIRQTGSDIEFVTDEFRIWRNDEIKFEVRLIAGEVVVNKDGEHFDRKRAKWLPPLIGAAPAQEPVESRMERFLKAHEPYVRATGKVVALDPQERQQTVTSPVEGIVRGVLGGMVEGRKVRRGEILVEIAPKVSDLSIKVKTSLKDLENRLATAASEASVKRQNILLQEQVNDALLQTVNDSINAAKAKRDAKVQLLAGAEAKQQQSRLNYERQKALFDKGLGTKQTMERFEKERQIAISELNSATLDLTAAKKEWEARKSERTAKMREAEAKLDHARAKQRDALGRGCHDSKGAPGY